MRVDFHKVARALAGGAGTIVTGAAYIVGVPYAGEAFDASTELARRGISDVGASLGSGGLDSLKYENITPSSAAQFMAEVRNRPGVSPLAYKLSVGTEITGDVAWTLAQGLQGTKLGSMELGGPWSGSGGLSAAETTSSAAVRQQVLANIAESQAGRASSNFTEYLGTETMYGLTYNANAALAANPALARAFSQTRNTSLASSRSASPRYSTETPSSEW